MRRKRSTFEQKDEACTKQITIFATSTPPLKAIEGHATTYRKETLNPIGHDIYQSIPPRIIRTQDAENCHIERIADEFRRRCGVYEAQSGTGQATLTLADTEALVAEAFAKEQDLCIPIERNAELGSPGISGNENKLYVSDDIIFKVNNLINSGSILALLEKALMHNQLFPETFYRIYGFTGFGGRSVYPILQQNLVKEAEPAPQIAINANCN